MFVWQDVWLICAIFKITMNKRIIQFPNIQKKRLAVILITSVIAMLGIWWAASAYYESQKTYPLGQQLEYVGKRSYGCSGFCDSAAGETYSYTTDMTPDQLVTYFKGAQLKSIPMQGNWDAMGSSFMIDLQHLSSQESFPVYYHTDAQERITSFKLKPSTKKHLIDIDKKDYAVAEQALDNN